MTCFSQNNWLSSKYSTHHAILNLTDEILTSFENGQFILRVLIDLSKAFDTVNHSSYYTNMNSMESKANA